MKKIIAATLAAAIAFSAGTAEAKGGNTNTTNTQQTSQDATDACLAALSLLPTNSKGITIYGHDNVDLLQAALDVCKRNK